jgi:alginate O-acetyltransferase complex protein AlgI
MPAMAPWLIPATASVLSHMLAPWQAMCVIAFGFLAGFKCLTWQQHRKRVNRAADWRTLAYFFAWPGLDADRFGRAGRTGPPPPISAGLAPLVRTAFGAVLVWGVVPRMPVDWPCLTGAIGLAGLVALLHFGAFDLIALLWQRAGIDAEPLMDRPLAATSLAEFWGRRWNRAYHRVSLDLFFRPLARRLGTGLATLAAFFASGILHDLVISVPAGAVYGGPTAYFMLQGVGLLLERTTPLRQVLAGHPAVGWCFTAGFILAPIGWLFHPPFLTQVILPFLKAIGA